MGSSNKRWIIFLFIGFSLSSCSWISTRKSLFETGESGDSGEKKSAEQMQAAAATTVPKDQYDSLLKKYEYLQGKVQEMELKNNGGLEDKKSPEDIVEALNNLEKSSDGKAELVETVDVFSGKKGLSNQPVVPVTRPLTSAEIQDEITRLANAKKLLTEQKFNEALTILRVLETSQVRQVRVRAKFYIGELIFVQKDYDLAMQIFEEIIGKEAFSGVVIKVLGRLIVCSQKLSLKKKQERYYSLLHDFFESV